jgi:hypothetical protein
LLTAINLLSVLPIENLLEESEKIGHVKSVTLEFEADVIDIFSQPVGLGSDYG